MALTCAVSQGRARAANRPANERKTTMDEIIIKAVQQGGPVTIVIGIIALVVIKYLIPLADRALAAHREDLARVLAEGKDANQTVVQAFRDSQDRQERQTERLIQIVIEKLGGELTLMRKDLDQVVVKIDGMHNDLIAARKGA